RGNGKSFIKKQSIFKNLQNGNQNTILTVIEYALFYFSEELRELTDLFPTIPQPEYINIVTY
ncbi:MAG TPA: hypothetical protein PKX71_03150, partial [Candidatus Avimonas sp.]|nr:hypothetical protein [Candidatus Avimonas sp.]HQD37681.1 hypothetical protein [Candidatus Avimonas sp.]